MTQPEPATAGYDPTLRLVLDLLTRRVTGDRLSDVIGPKGHFTKLQRQKMAALLRAFAYDLDPPPDVSPESPECTI